jgi:coenzyme F420-0:L-glutamate ligase/coenzyme F420-1:gamma-L-glutamate ligase
MRLELLPVLNVPDIRAGTNLGICLRDAAQASGYRLQPHDVLAVAQKIVSKAEGRIVRLASVEPSPHAVSIARRMTRDPRLIEVILRESRRIVRMRADVLICETHHGFICANAGVDQSNVDDAETVTLLPKDPDRSARDLAESLDCGVIVTDTFGRVWREGLVDAAIGVARVPPFIDLRGATDAYGRPLRATVLASVDALAAAAGLVMGKASKTPAVLVRGFQWEETGAAAAAMLLRTPDKDLFL